MKKILMIFGVVSIFLAMIVFFLVNTGKKYERDVNNSESKYHSLEDYSKDLNKKRSSQQKKDWLFGNRGCKGSGPVEFDNLPMRTEDFISLIPYGMMIGSHVTPIDHQYFAPKDYNSPRDAYEVRAVADGTILEIQHRTGSPKDGKILSEYRLVFEHSCTFLSYMDLITSLAPKIMKEAKEILESKKYWTGRIPVRAGQLIGRIGGQTLDFGVYNQDITLGFINLESYKTEPWKIHTDKTIKYFRKDLQEILNKKNLRKADPVDGMIDYDIDGKLAGNWFREGTNGYGGKNLLKYWEGHLSFARDHIDPTGIIISLGDFGGKSVQAIVGEGSPDPADVGQEFGKVKYELYQTVYYNQKTGVMWDQITPINNLGVKEAIESYGTVMAEVLEDRKIKFEVFPRKKAEQVTEFTKNARIYVR